MKTRIGLAIAAVLAFFVVGGMGISTADEGVSVDLNPKNNSGISGTAEYGSDSVTATASGMNPDKEYYSFYYGAGSDSDGDNPCILTGETLAGPTNTIGKWEVDSDGNGTLSGTSFGSPESAGTMSIREDDTNLGGVTGPLPVNSLVACGDVGAEQNTTLGNVQDQVPQIPTLPDVSPVGTLVSGNVEDNTDAVSSSVVQGSSDATSNVEPTQSSSADESETETESVDG